jgi:uncharacterized membrane protein YeaQ/YmgE (transglycosylase-associated protein family)
MANRAKKAPPTRPTDEERANSRWHRETVRQIATGYGFLQTRDEELEMSIIGWIVLGLIAGFIASKIVNERGEGMMLDIVLGIVGGVVGGWLFSFFGAEGVTGFNLYSMVVAVIGAIVVLFIYHAVTGRRTAG